MKHERMEMTKGRRFPTRSRPTAGYKHGKNIWLRSFECPVCGLEKNPPESSNGDRKVYCDGSRTKAQRDKEKFRGFVPLNERP